jgi:predicted kinase
MRESFIIFVSGIPAAGKTQLATELASRLRLPMIGKDPIKTLIWEKLHIDPDSRAEKKAFGALAYDICFLLAEELMKAGYSFIFESNFTQASAAILVPLIEKYDYKTLTVVLDADMKTLHQRFLEREDCDDRHPGLKRGANFKDFEEFKRAAEKVRQFSVGGRRINIDTTDWSKVDYEAVLGEIKQIVG